MPFVLDASVAASWFLKEADHPHVDVAWRRLRADTAVVPSIWWYEIRNVLLMAERKQLLAQQDVDQAWRQLRHLRVDVDPVLDDRQSRDLARRHGLTFYDAAYVELAQRFGYSLATRDRAMADAAKAENIHLIDEAG